jgi:hypothetical protein
MERFEPVDSSKKNQKGKVSIEKRYYIASGRNTAKKKLAT